MRQKNAEIVGQMVEAFVAVGFAEAARRFCDPGFVFEEPPEQPTPAVAEGREKAIRRDFLIDGQCLARTGDLRSVNAALYQLS